ncbi:MAG: vitamin B12 dependent-methionine synthase activation domain-containing protein, partial [Spirochaetia bacterium]
AHNESTPVDSHKNNTALPPEEQLEELVLEGTHAGLLPVLDSLLKHTAPDKIINNLLIPAMKRVGELFGKGKLQLPFVLQSAEVMKQAVGYLEPFMEKQTNTPGKSIVLATVRGDVHDIGKNLVDIILSNNGYKVYNLGIKVDIDTILKKAQEVQARAIGMSGLLVKSTGIMKSNIEAMHERNLHIPVLLGGAALTREFVEQECAPLLNAPVFYCKDAFDGLQAMERIGETPGAALTDAPAKASREKPLRDSSGEVSDAQPHPELIELASPAVPLPESNDIEQLSLDFDSLIPYINRKRLFRARWGYRRGASSEQEYLELEEAIIQPEFEKLTAWLAEGHIAPPKAAFRLLPCNRTGDNRVHIFEGSPQAELYSPAAEFKFSRQSQPPHLSVADYFLPDSVGRHDLIGLQIVTLRTAIQGEIHRLFSNDNYRDYLHLHGLAVELTEAAAEYVQSLMYKKLQIPESGKRYSFGYPCCPDLTANRTIAALLKAEELGISFTEDDQMVPELSTAAFICFNPQADYFSL